MKVGRLSRIGSGVSLRIFLAVFAALAMLSAPLAISPGRAMAMAPANPHA
jgi:hypothetical protein